jgi:phenylacetate-CoA ligase
VHIASRGEPLGEYGVRLAIVHSEQSSRAERDELAQRLRVTVLDEYSSEELTRVALECPSHCYHIEEDAAYIEIVEIGTDNPVPEGVLGEVIGTNLNNRAMPLIRYRQGDLATLEPRRRCDCGSNFRALASIDGRVHDAFLTPSGRVVPGGALMDAAYHWRLSLGLPVHGLEYVITQERLDRVVVDIVPPDGFRQGMDAPIVRQLERLLGEGVAVVLRLVDSIPSQGRKRRSIVSLVNVT